jgi:signal transduction histidine kinase
MHRASTLTNDVECLGPPRVVIGRTEDRAVTDAYEIERARLSRELHDDIAQRIAIVSAELGMLRHRLTDAPAEIQQHVADVATEIASIGSDLHRIARGLHPAGLERLGLGASIRRHCEQLTKVHRMTIDVALGELPPALDADAALCVYRIAQEALHNVVKHSRASHAAVSVRTGRGELLLRVIDDGVGFEPKTVRREDALGLVSMRERARLARAQLFVSSAPGRGTAIEVHVPIRQSVVCFSA